MTDTPPENTQPPNSETPWLWLRRSARAWGFGAFVLVILYAFREVILPFVLALLVAYILAPAVRQLERVRPAGHRVPRFIWIILVYAVLLGLIGLFFTSFVPRLSNDLKRVLQETPAMMEKARKVWVPKVAGWVEENVGEDGVAEGARGEGKEGNGKGKGKGKVNSPDAGVAGITVRELAEGGYQLELSEAALEVEKTGEKTWQIRRPRPDPLLVGGDHKVEDAINNYIGGLVTRSEQGLHRLVGLARELLGGILKAITTFILVLMVSAFLLADTDRLLAWLRNLIPRIYNQDLDNVVVLIDKGLSGAIRGQFVICIINGILTWVGLHVIGIKYPLLLGLLAGVMSLIPIFGSIISSIPIVLVALVSGSEGVELLRGVLILLWIIGIHLLEANLLNPKIMGTAAKIHPVLVVFAVVAGEQTYGAVGALLGVPLFSAVQAVFLYLRRKARGELDEGEQEMAGENGQEDPGT